MNALKNIDRLQVNHDFLLTLLSVYESKGKEFYYDEVLQRDKLVFTKNVVEENTYFLSEYFNLDLTEARLKSLAKRNLTHKNKTEALVNNFKKAINSIHIKKGFKLITNEVIELANLLSKNNDKIQINTYQKDNTLLANKRNQSSKRELLEQLVSLYDQTVRGKKFEIIQIITNFYIDLLQMDIFSIRNKEIANIIMYALLYNEFTVFKYISFFKYFSKYRERWEIAVTQASYNWQSGYAQTDQLSRILVEVILESYRDIDEFLHEYVFEQKLNKTDNIENTVLKGPEVFSKKDIRKLHPTTSEATIDRTLKRLKDEGIIRPLGRGRSAKWIRLVEGNNKINYEKDLFTY